MKKTLLLAAFAAIAFISCQKKEINVEEPAGTPVEESVGIPMKLVVDIPTTKVNYTPDGNVLKASWKATETISVLTLDGAGQLVTVDHFTSTGAAGRTKAEFSGTFNGGSTPASVIVIYPALTEEGGGKYATDPYTDHTASARSVLYGAEVGSMYIQGNFQPLLQSSDDDASHLENFCVMSGDVDIADIKNNVLTATLSHEMIVLKVVATFPSVAKGKTLTKMQIDAFDSTDAPASMERSHSWEYIDIPDNPIIGRGSGYHEFSQLYCNFTIPDTGVVVLYFVNCKYADQAIGNKWKFTAHVGAGTDTYVATKTFKAAASFDKGSIYRVSADLIPAGALKSKFTINAGGDQVYFSQGNLQATYDGSDWSWALATNQWDYIGNAAANTSINGDGTVSANGTVDLFGWVGASGGDAYGISNREGAVDYYGNVNDEELKSDWGNCIGAGWRTPTNDEWYYLLKERTSGATVNGTSNARRVYATINTDATPVTGMILFPDGVTILASEATSWSTINGEGSFAESTKCTSAQWSALAAKGCVFLPTTGLRNGANVPDYQLSYGYYWSSSHGSYSDRALNVKFGNNSVAGTNWLSRYYGAAVRLVHDL